MKFSAELKESATRRVSDLDGELCSGMDRWIVYGSIGP